MKSLFHLYLYGSIHIALSTVALLAFSYACLDLAFDRDYAIFLFSGTVFLYNLHRLVGIYKNKDRKLSGRLQTIHDLRFGIILLSAISLVSCIWYYLSFEWSIQRILLIPALISALYVIPIFPKAKRVRDLPFVKIFMIAISYALLTVWIPMNNNGLSADILLTAERALFLIAITIPFDIRDQGYDGASGLLSIPIFFGDKTAKRLAILLAVAGALIFYFRFNANNTLSFSMICSYLAAVILIVLSNDGRRDYYYTFWMDGLMAMPFLLYFIGQLMI